jgi:hypothetical protein
LFLTRSCFQRALIDSPAAPSIQCHICNFLLGFKGIPLAFPVDAELISLLNAQGDPYGTKASASP